MKKAQGPRTFCKQKTSTYLGSVETILILPPSTPWRSGGRRTGQMGALRASAPGVDRCVRCQGGPVVVFRTCT